MVLRCKLANSLPRNWEITSLLHCGSAAYIDDYDGPSSEIAMLSKAVHQESPNFCLQSCRSSLLAQILALQRMSRLSSHA